MQAKTIESTEVDQNMVGLLRLAIERVDRDPKAATRKYSHTFQTRRTVNALLALGLKRTDFRARTECDRATGEYSSCIGSPHGREANLTIARWARELVEVGFQVHLGNNFAFTSLGGRTKPGITDLRTEGKKMFMHGEERDG